MPEPISCAACGAINVPLALSSKSGFKRRVCASVVGCRKRQETNRAIAAAESRGRRQMIDALRVVSAPLIGADVPDSPQVVAGRDRIVIRSAADVLIAHMRTEIHGDQGLRMAQKMLEQQGEINDLKRAVAGLREALEASEAECAKVIEERDRLRRVGRCGNESATLDPSASGLWCDLPAGHDGWHGADQPTEAGFSTRAEWTYTQSHDGPETALRATLEPERGQPRVWAMPPEPGPDVDRVRDVYGQGFTRAEAYNDDGTTERGWLGDAFTDEGDVPDLFLTWKQLMAHHAPLTEAPEVVEPDGD